MNPYEPPVDRQLQVSADETSEPMIRTKIARILGACIFACAFAIVGDLVIQPYLNAYFGLPHPQAMAAFISTLIGANLGYRICEGLT